MADDMHRAARYRGDHRFGMRRFILRREYRLMKASDNQVQRVQHRAGTVDFATGIFDIGFDTSQDANAIHQPRPDTHINKMPVVRRIGHIGPVVGNGKEFDPCALLARYNRAGCCKRGCWRRYACAGQQDTSQSPSLFVARIAGICAHDQQNPAQAGYRLVSQLAIDLPADRFAPF